MKCHYTSALKYTTFFNIGIIYCTITIHLENAWKITVLTTTYKILNVSYSPYKKCKIFEENDMCKNHSKFPTLIINKWAKCITFLITKKQNV